MFYNHKDLCGIRVVNSAYETLFQNPANQKTHLKLASLHNISDFAQTFSIFRVADGESPALSNRMFHREIEASATYHIEWGGPGIILETEGEKIIAAAVGSGGIWASEELDDLDTDITGTRTRIAVDNLGKVHIIYRQETQGHLKYITNKYSSWVQETIDATADVGEYSDIQIDSNGFCHVLYYDKDNTALKYAHNIYGGWAISEIASSGEIGSHCALALDTNDKLHVTYYDSENAGLFYGTNSSGSWAFTDMDIADMAPADDTGQFSDIALDSSGKVHIVYYNATTSDLKYATNSSGSWVSSLIDGSTSAVGTFARIAADTNDDIHIAYYDATNTNLKYATNATGSWVLSTLDYSGAVGDHIDLTLDNNNKVHISYRYASGANLKYATNMNGYWSYQTVDYGRGAGLVGEYTSIAVIPDGTVFIAYHDTTQGSLRLASNGGGVTAQLSGTTV